LTDDGVNFCKMRVGINKTIHFVKFLEQLEDFLREVYAGIDENGNERYLEYRKKLILIFDNAGIHSTSLVYDFCKN